MLYEAYNILLHYDHGCSVTIFSLKKELRTDTLHTLYFLDKCIYLYSFYNIFKKRYITRQKLRTTEFLNISSLSRGYIRSTS